VPTARRKATFFTRVLGAECGARQVRVANVVLVHGGVLPSQVTAILSTRAALCSRGYVLESLT